MDTTPTATSTLGGFIVAQCFAILLFGIMVAQSYVYMLNCKGDRPVLKLLVAAVALLEAVQTAFLIHVIYNYTISDFGNIGAADKIIWSNSSSVALEMIIVGLVQGFYMYRIWILSRGSLLLVITTSILLLARVSFGLATSALLFKFKFFSAYREHFVPRVVFTCGLALSVAVDAIIAALLVYFLIRDKPGFKATDNVVRTLVVYFVNTGVVTMLVSTVIVILFFAFPDSLLFAGMVLVAAKLYSNSLLGTLNARQLLRRRVEDVYDTSELSTFRTGRRTGRRNMENLRFHIQKTVETHSSLSTAQAPPEKLHPDKSTLGNEDV